MHFGLTEKKKTPRDAENFAFSENLSSKYEIFKYFLSMNRYLKVSTPAVEPFRVSPPSPLHKAGRSGRVTHL